MGETVGWVEQVNVSSGGVPKLPVERARVDESGVAGDRQRNLKVHGGPDRAVCLFSLTVIEQLRTEGHPIAPGTIGENLTVGGLDFGGMTSGVRLRIGETVLLEITGYASPCQNIAASFRDGEFVRVSPKLHPGDSRLYARVLTAGTVAAGDSVSVLA